MFGNCERPIKPKLKPRPVPRVFDVTGINMVGHMAPEPNSCYNYKIMQYKQRQNELDTASQLVCANNLRNEQMLAKYLVHFDKREFTRTLDKRVNKKMVEYEEQIEIRRAKLRKLLYEEERFFTREVVDSAQSASEQLMQARIQQVTSAKEQREAERLEIVRQSKLRQYLDRCAEFRPVLANGRLRETKQVQLQQMQETEARKICERESARMWHEMVMAEMKTQLAREEAEAAKKQSVKEELQCINALCMKRLDEQKAQREREINEEKKVLDKLKNEIELEDKAAHEAKLAKRNEVCRSINAQMTERQETLRQQANNEQAIANTYCKLVDEQLAKERLASEQRKVTGKQDMILYQRYLKELRQTQLQEHKRMEDTMQRSMLEIQQKQAQDKCNLESARNALLEKVMNERAAQIEYQRRQKEQQAALQQEDAKWCTAVRRVNEQLSNETVRQRQLAALKYSEELQKQMEYSKVCEKRVQAELDEILAAAKREEKLYNEIVLQATAGNIQIGDVHPFRQGVNPRKCHCPE